MIVDGEVGGVDLSRARWCVEAPRRRFGTGRRLWPLPVTRPRGEGRIAIDATPRAERRGIAPGRGEDHFTTSALRGPESVASDFGYAKRIKNRS